MTHIEDRWAKFEELKMNQISKYYHEQLEMEERAKRLKNYSDKVKQIEDRLLKEQAIGSNLGVSQLKNELDEAIKKMKSAHMEWEEAEKEYIKPFKIMGRGGLAWRNPNIDNKYYPCYWNGEGNVNDNEIHKFIAKNEIFNFFREFFEVNYPGKEFEDLVVHHVDKNPDNFDQKNLSVISYEEHNGWKDNKTLHEEVPLGNWLAGIEALKKRGIKQPHIQELADSKIL